MEATHNKTANPFTISGNWEEQAKKLKGKFSQLTDADVKFEVGKESDLLRRLETKLHMKREDVIYLIKKNMPANL
ncbi:MAG: hypothetical protein CFE21_14050 [Bacteroidetes bacterium B1(2017)]|nr:MAG: hypothetical protein CFE21_14050 [Bacteroidetes bacterium B1(2017)]